METVREINKRLKEAYNRGYSLGYQDGYYDGANNVSHGIEHPYAMDERLSLPIQTLNLSTHAFNCLDRSGCKYIGDVVKLTNEQICRIRGMGKITADEIAKALHNINIRYCAWDGFLME